MPGVILVSSDSGIKVTDIREIAWESSALCLLLRSFNWLINLPVRHQFCIKFITNGNNSSKWVSKSWLNCLHCITGDSQTNLTTNVFLYFLLAFRYLKLLNLKIIIWINYYYYYYYYYSRPRLEKIEIMLSQKK